MKALAEKVTSSPTFPYGSCEITAEASAKIKHFPVLRVFLTCWMKSFACSSVDPSPWRRKRGEKRPLTTVKPWALLLRPEAREWHLPLQQLISDHKTASSKSPSSHTDKYYSLNHCFLYKTATNTNIVMIVHWRRRKQFNFYVKSFKQ